MIAAAEQAYPREAVGLVFEDDYVPLRNIADADAFEIDPVEWARVTEHRAPVALFHSHPTDLPIPSRADFEGAREWPHLLHVIASLRGKPEIHAWRLVDGQALPEKIQWI